MGRETSPPHLSAAQNWPQSLAPHATTQRATSNDHNRMLAAAPVVDAPIAPINRGGRPKKATGRALLVEICARVATGETLTAIAKESGMPSPPRFRAEVARDPELAELWREAKQERPHALFDEALDIARELKNTEWKKDDAHKVRAKQVAIEALRIAASRLNPREYGDKGVANVVVPVQINTTLGLDPNLPPAKARKEYHYEALPPVTEEPMDNG